MGVEDITIFSNLPPDIVTFYPPDKHQLKLRTPHITPGQIESPRTMHILTKFCFLEKQLEMKNLESNNKPGEIPNKKRTGKFYL